jgi:transcription antitermination factor NusG
VIGYALGEAQFAQIVENIRKSNNLEDEARFKEALKQEGLSMDDLRRNLERQMLVSQVQRAEIMDKISISDEEARAYYEQHRTEFTSPTEVTLREILLEVPASDRGVNVAQDDAIRATAEDLRKRLLAGEPFARLAGEQSAAASKANGGLIGPIHSDELAPATAESAGVDERRRHHRRAPRAARLPNPEARIADGLEGEELEEARGDIGNRIGEQKLTGEREKYLEKLREQATITWRNEELKKAYETALGRRHQDSPRQPRRLRRNEGRPRGRSLMAESWFALWTRSRHEQVVRDQLEQKHIEAFLPTVTAGVDGRIARRKIDWPLFPGYCFARFNPRERLPILKCTGVVNIISFEGEPAAIPEREIDGIRRLVESDLAYDPCPMIREGMVVEVVHGPLTGRRRTSRTEERQARLVLSVDLIGQAVSVEVDAADVKPY